jgi:DNA-binding MarR family transcriptional regulator
MTLYCQVMPDSLEMLPLLVADVFEAAGALRSHGDRLAGAAGQTQARWQLLSVISEGEWTAPRAARRLGITRQSVQRVADALAADGLLDARPNPHHARSPLLRITEDGRSALSAITAEAREWHARVAPTVDADEMAVARRVLHALIGATELRGGEPRL